MPVTVVVRPYKLEVLGITTRTVLAEDLPSELVVIPFGLPHPSGQSRGLAIVL